MITQLGYEAAPDDIQLRLSRLLLHDDQQLFVAESGGAIVGWVHVIRAEYLEADPFVVIGGLVVDRECRRQGIGRRLMLEAEAWARTQRCTVVRLSSSVTRTAAHEFYERLGYTKIKTQYAFAKGFDGSAGTDWSVFVPRVDERGGKR